MSNARTEDSGKEPYWRANIKNLHPIIINAATHSIVLIKFINPP